MELAISDFNKTPQGSRLHISLFGRRNVGKSSLINALVGYKVSLVTDMAGTTTDPVSKAIEIYPLGTCLITDTAGIDDCGDVGLQRVALSKKAIDHTDIAIFVCDGILQEQDLVWVDMLKECNIPTVIAQNKSDIVADCKELAIKNKERTGFPVVAVSANSGDGLSVLLEEIVRLTGGKNTERPLLGNLVAANDIVLLVMPQNIQAPKGRLILPQVQTLRALLDEKCRIISCTSESFCEAVSMLKEPPKLIITDSQEFDSVYKNKPTGVPLTSFSVLMAAEKGDINYLMEGARHIAQLKETSKVLIAEACTHVPQNEDIGRVKLPRLLRSKIDEHLHIDIVSGKDFPDDLSDYDLVIHCGACMFNRTYMLSRINKAKIQKKAMTNYGLAIAFMKGIIDKIVVP